MLVLRVSLNMMPKDIGELCQRELFRSRIGFQSRGCHCRVNLLV